MPRHISFAIPASPESAGLARKLTENVLHAWTSLVDDYTTALLLSEVFTNALLHGVDPRSGTAARIGIDLVETETGLHVEVHDPNQGKRGVVAVNHATMQSESGRGLELVAALSASWGYKQTPTGKLVYFDMVAPARERDGEVFEDMRGPAVPVVNHRDLHFPASASLTSRVKGGSL